MRKMPVQLTSTSTPPKRSTAESTSACACSRVGDLAGVDRDALAASGRARRCAASSLAARVPLRTTRAPSSRKRARRGLADAAAAAGDQDDLVLVLPHASDLRSEDRCMCIEYTCICI